MKYIFIVILIVSPHVFADYSERHLTCNGRFEWYTSDGNYKGDNEPIFITITNYENGLTKAAWMTFDERVSVTPTHYLYRLESSAGQILRHLEIDRRNGKVKFLTTYKDAKIKSSWFEGVCSLSGQPKF